MESRSRNLSGDRRRFGRMSGTRMVIVQIDRKLMSQLLVSADRILEQPVLKIVRKIRP
jgi:hypothetical protein